MLRRDVVGLDRGRGSGKIRDNRQADVVEMYEGD